MHACWKTNSLSLMDGQDQGLSNYLTFNLMDLDIYSLLNENEKEIVCEHVSEAIARAYGTEALDYIDWDLVGLIV